MDQWEPMVSVAVNVCQEIVNISQQPLFYTINLKSDVFGMHFIQQLHEASVQTILISHPSEMNRVVISDHGKNMIFILEDIYELLNFIFHTIAKKNSLRSHQNFVSRQKNNGNHSMEDLPQYCIKVDERLLRVNEEKMCDEQVNMTREDLEAGSVLPDHVFNKTRGFYGSKIWNAKNYLVFVLKSIAPIPPSHRHRAGLPCQKWTNETINNHSHVDLIDSLMFCFKFFWRFFKGQRTLICHPGGCEQYDPFTENLVSQGEEAGEDFFDFSWSDMHLKVLRVYGSQADWMKENLDYIVREDYKADFDSKFLVTFPYIAHSLNCNVYEVYHASHEVDADLKFDIDLHQVDIGINHGGIDYSQFDFSVSFDSGALGIAVPHSGFMSQVFLSGMTTLLSERVPQSDIDSLKMLEESHVLIQTQTFFNVKDIQSSFDRQGISEALKGKLVDSLEFYTDKMINAVDPTLFFANYPRRYENRSLFIGNISRSLVEKMEECIRSVATTDAVLVHLPIATTPKESLFMRHFLMTEEFEYHLMKEYIMTDPWMIVFKKNSFVFDRLNKIIARYLETGHTRKALEKLIPSNLRFDVSSGTIEGKKPRPYNIDDLQSAFIGLIVGLFLSFLVFLYELSIDDLQDTVVVKILCYFKNAYLTKIRR
ncbi:unnamed protein product [Bemisia tabaci]|uniref:Ionotropic receptor n=1 Tax=Bemisia tabaci TaxID=7038 RepID=A0A9P0ADF7_BEMTA|nr:unnamed protein product [Bemisia tabaci]